MTGQEMGVRGRPSEYYFSMDLFKHLADHSCCPEVSHRYSVVVDSARSAIKSALVAAASASVSTYSAFVLITGKGGVAISSAISAIATEVPLIAGVSSLGGLSVSAWSLLLCGLVTVVGLVVTYIFVSRLRESLRVHDMEHCLNVIELIKGSDEAKSQEVGLQEDH